MIKDFKALKITLASPEQILNWSHGEVTKAETINYRTQKAETGGLMCERIFGPTKNYECYCGKYKKVRYRGIICDKCGVEVTSKSVRRERMGHIKLVSPVTHVWYAHGVPNKLSLLLDIMPKKLTAVIYFSRFMVVEMDKDEKVNALEKVNKTLEVEKQKLSDELAAKIDEINKEKDEEIEKLRRESNESADILEMTIEKQGTKFRQRIARLREEYLIMQNELDVEFKSLISLIEKMEIGEILSEDDYYKLLDNDVEFFELSMGAEAIKRLLSKVNLEEVSENLKKDINSPSLQKRLKAIQRLKIIEGFRTNNIKPEWIVMDQVPVISPELRPIIQLMGGRFASADLNDLYRRVINRNNRLKRLMELGAPEIILRNEKRMLQEAVDALVDNAHRPSTPVVNSRKMPLKSLSDQLRGKQGRFRQNLLGKRVDYSGRAVIVCGADLSLNECGIPKTMALELFRPFVMREILERGLAPNIKSAKNFFESQAPEVWDILEEVSEKRPVLLNRAPTLHKQGIQAFYPVLSDGSAIRLNPLVCSGFNADFDGDQMAVHLPLSEEAVEEAKSLMMAKSNLLLEADGSPVMNPKNDMVYGNYYLTGIDKSIKASDRIFGTENEAIYALDTDAISLRQIIKVMIRGEIIETTVGKIIFNEMLPDTFDYVNYQVGSDEIKELVQKFIHEEGMEKAVIFLDKVKDSGFKYATLSGFSFSMDDCKMIPERDEIIGKADEKVSKLEENYQTGLITKGEKSRLALAIWQETTDTIAQLTWDNLEDTNPIKDVIKAKAMKASIDQVKQISGMRGILLAPDNKKIELPVRSNFSIGLSEIEYFVGSRSTRKVLADTALRTAESGYLTRKLVDVAQGIIVRSEDCMTTDGIDFLKTDKRRIAFQPRIEGRWAAKDIKLKSKVLVKAGDMIDYNMSVKITETDEIESINLRSPLTCKAKYGICIKCYGYDLAKKSNVIIGTAVGVIAAQSLGEATTQLTLNTKHKGGIAGVVDVTEGLPRVEELFEARIPKGKAIIADIDGTIAIVENENNEKVKVRITSNQRKAYEVIMLPEDKLSIKDGAKVKAGDLLFISNEKGTMISPFRGTVKIEDNKITVESERVQEVEYAIPSDAELLVQNGDQIAAGFLITKGNIDPKILLETFGMSKAQKYIVDNIQETYGAQGISIDEKHVEVIVAQMGRYVRVLNPGQSLLLPGEFKDKYEVDTVNADLKAKGEKPVIVKPQLVGITAASLRTESFLSAASFQEQVRVLSEAAIMGKVDYLRGLKENVIIGRRIPTGQKAQTI